MTDNILESQSQFFKSDLKFYLWNDKVQDPITNTEPFIYTLEEFCDTIRSEDPKTETKNSLWIINNTDDKGKQQINFTTVPKVIFVDIDFHSKEEKEKEMMIQKFFADTNVKSFEEFIEKLSKDPYCLMGGLSKSGKGLRLFFLVQSDYGLEECLEDKHFTNNQIIQLHEKNWYTVMKYLKDTYNVITEADYCHDTSAKGIQQGTYYFRKEGSFVNLDCKWMYQEEIVESREKKVWDGKSIQQTKWDESSLKKLLKDNLPIFKDMAKSWEPYLKLLTYVLPDQPQLIFEFFFEIIREHYKGDAFKQSDNFEAFKRRFKKLPPRTTAMPLDAFFRKIGINLPYEFEDYTFEMPIIIEDDSTDRNELKKYHKALGKAPVHTVIDDTIEIFDFKNDYIEKKYLLYPLIKEGQLAILFGVTGEGKSILLTEIANFIAQGFTHWDGFRVDTKPQNVIYIDFELGGESFKSRYKEGKFNKNLKIINVQNNIYNSMIGWENKQSDRLDRAISYIEECANKFNSKVIFIDNLSNIADQVEKTAEADRFIADLYARMKADGLTIFFIGHTPKIATESSLTLNQLKGSSSLSKTFESIIGFKRSNEKNISYIKQLKHRQLDCVFDEYNVGKFEFDEFGDFGWTMNFIGSGSEIELLPEATKGGRPNKYDNKFKCEVLYELNLLNTKTKDVIDKYVLSKGTLFRIREDLREDRYNLVKDFEKYCKMKNDEKTLEIEKNKLQNKMRGVQIL